MLLCHCSEDLEAWGAVSFCGKEGKGMRGPNRISSGRDIFAWGFLPS